MHVVLCTSPHIRHGSILQRDCAPHPEHMYSFVPAGLLLLLAVIRDTRPEYTATLYDINRRVRDNAIPLTDQFYEALAADICVSRPDVVGFMTECDSYHHILQIAHAVKQLRPACYIVLGGPHASVVAERTLQTCESVDAVVVGEGELTLPNLLDVVARRSPSPVAGAIIRSNGRLEKGPSREIVDCLDELPIPAFELYQPISADDEIFLEVGRGCPFKCTFCSTAPFFNRRHRVKSAERILREIREVRSRYGAKRIHFTHDLFTTKRAWVEEVCAVLSMAGSPVEWTCSARTDTVDEELLITMRKAGCSAIYFGLESGSTRILREIRKDIPLEHSFKILEQCASTGIKPNVGFIAGFPTEDAESLRDTFESFERALRMGIRPTHMFGFCPFAGASMYASLGDLTCTGHFIDLPLSMNLDAQNREIVSNDRELFGSYFRPPLPSVIDGDPSAMDSLDEFSPLVEAALAPSLSLARCVGGMYEVFSMWRRWICHHNDSRSAAPHRRGYGGAVEFGKFLLESLVHQSDATRADVEVATAVYMNLTVTQSSGPSAATFAAYRSINVPRWDGSATLTLNHAIHKASVVETLALDFDVTPALLGVPMAEYQQRPTFLVWQLIESEAVRLVCVDRPLFDVIKQADAGGRIADVVLSSLGAWSPGETASIDHVIDVVTRAVSEGFVTLGEPC